MAPLWKLSPFSVQVVPPSVLTELGAVKKYCEFLGRAIGRVCVPRSVLKDIFCDLVVAAESKTVMVGLPLAPIAPKILFFNSVAIDFW